MSLWAKGSKSILFTTWDLKEAGVKYNYLENAQAGHSWTTWRADLQVLAPTLFR